MGTNYYAEFGVCCSCGHAKKRLHIGKLSGGWEFSFRGYKDMQPALVSLEAWRTLLEAEGKETVVRIVDEYGAVETVEEFFALVLKTKGQQNHHDYCKRHVPFEIEVWKDDVGWSFTGQEFS